MLVSRGPQLVEVNLLEHLDNTGEALERIEVSPVEGNVRVVVVHRRQV